MVKRLRLSQVLGWRKPKTGHITALAHASDASTGKVETEGPEVQGYLQLRCDFEAILDYMGPWLKKMETSVY